MTLEKADLTAEQLMQVRDRSLEEAYEVHDIGMGIFTGRLQSHGLDYQEHGDDARHADQVFFADGPDLAILNDGEVVGYVEIKVKEKAEWVGRCNLRHFREYVNFAQEVDVPVFLWFALVEGGDGPLKRDAFVRVEDTDQIDGEVVDVSDDTLVFCMDDVRELGGGGERDLRVIDGSDLVSVNRRDAVVDSIPNVHGNDVIELNDDDFRSWPHFLHVIDA